MIKYSPIIPLKKYLDMLVPKKPPTDRHTY